jgi:hypothetical protein
MEYSRSIDTTKHLRAAGKTHKFHVGRGFVCAPARSAIRFCAIGRAEAGEYRFGVVDVTMERNSVRSVRPEQHANETLDALRASFLCISRTVLAAKDSSLARSGSRELYRDREQSRFLSLFAIGS